MAEKPVFLTQEGLTKLESELEYLRHTRRQEIADRINEATPMGGASDDGEYDDAKKEQAFVEGRIQTIERMIRLAQIIPEGANVSGIVQIGSTVTVDLGEGDAETYTIVGSAEAQPRQGKISNESPVGRALLGRKVGDEIQVMAPSGLITMRVSKVA